MTFFHSLENSCVTFGGQATPWRDVLADILSDPGPRDAIGELISESDKVLAPLAAQLASISGGGLTLDNLGSANTPVYSVPGILATHYGLLYTVARSGLSLDGEAIGHSQGVLGAEIAKAWGTDHDRIVNTFALARLIGAATSRVAFSHSITSPAMLSVRGLPKKAVETVLHGTADIAITNGHNSYVISGLPADLARVENNIDKLLERDKRELSQKNRGGAPLNATLDYLDVPAPFHHKLLAPALAQVESWAEQCGVDAGLASAVLTDPVDWPALVNSVDATWFVDLGPGSTVGRMTAAIVEGTGKGIIPASSLDEIDALNAPGFTPTRTQDWSQHAPQLVQLDSGTFVDTAFSRLTGYSPILLPGMTPTTVDPQIVAAAANRGFWAEMAGGGQVTADVFADNLAGLQEQLEPGRSAQFNAMFMDRYLWNLQFGGQRIVTKARTSGAPLNGVVISAGIPEIDEAPDLVAELLDSGFTHIVFKPGTVAQINQCLAIARRVDCPIILHVEDGHAGGHHSWENLDELLVATYAQIRREDNVIVCVGGGIGTPERAADYLSGQWSTSLDLPAMPVDGVLIGTAAMTAKEAKTTREVKELLVSTPGVSPDDHGGWVGSGASKGGMTSGLSHLRADMYEIDNDAAACARLIAEVESKPEEIKARREEIIEALNKTAKPYFGDLGDMTYAEVVTRFADLSYPWVDPSWHQRYWELLQRVEARLSDQDHGPIDTLFDTLADADDAHAAAERLFEAYPAAHDDTLTPADVAWFVALCRKYPKPMGFVPRLDDDLLRWWGQDSLWQAQDDRYEASACRIIPGPVSVAGITTVDEPIGDLLTRYEQATVERLTGAGVTPRAAFARLDRAQDKAELIRAVPFISWTGHLMDNPAHHLDPSQYTLTVDGDTALIDIHLDTYWDNHPGQVHAVKNLQVPLLLPSSVTNGGVPVVDESRLPDSMYALLAGTAGVGNTGVTGDHIEALPTMVDSEKSPYGQAHYSFTVSENLGADHTAVTGAALADHVSMVPDALLGPCWPAIYAALGSAQVNDFPVIEGLLNAVHLDHSITFSSAIPTGATVDVISWADTVTESASGRIVEVDLELFIDGTHVGSMAERFAIRGRASGTNLPADPAPAGGAEFTGHDTARSALSLATAVAPMDMTPFAWVSGDFNPIHTSVNAARVAGLEAPLVHGMWLSATAQHAAVAAAGPIKGWTYRMFGMVALGDTVEIQVDRVGRVDGGAMLLEVSCKIDGELVSQASALTDVPATAYVYPGQGIQSTGMGLAERAQSAAVAATWDQADAFTRDRLGFSIINVVQDNPTVLQARGVTYRHPEGVLNLTQFTQVALATLAFAQTERLKEAGALRDGAFVAGHSLGEYNALSAYAGVIPLETVLEVVFHRGSTMHNLVPRDEHGSSNYRMGALRPNQIGVGHCDIEDYVNGVAEQSGEFLEIVNYNLAGAQYAIAGTIAGLKALEADAKAKAEARGGRNPFMLVPGIDVPFHSRVLHVGVDDFREKLELLLPETIDVTPLVGRYIPNLVAIPFEISNEFVDAILDVVPSKAMKKIAGKVTTGDEKFARTILIELLCWQFACPVRWIETQDYLFTKAGISDFIEVGLGAAPTLANLASKTLALPTYTAQVNVLNVQRDEKRVYSEDVQVIDEPEVDDTPEAPESAPAVDETPAPAPAAPEAPAPEADTGGDANLEDLPFTASDAIKALLAYANKVRPDQIAPVDTVGTLTNGVSSRLNQLLMDFSAELGLPSVEGAAEADIATLSGTVDKAAHTYSAFGPVLSEIVKDRVRKLVGQAGLKPTAIHDRVENVWKLGPGWAAHATIALVLGTRDGASARGEDLATLPTNATSASEVNDVIDQAVRQAGSAHGLNPAIPSASSGGGAVVDSGALSEFAESITGETGILAENARHLLSLLGNDEVAEEETEDHSELFDAVSSELGSGWLQFVTPGFDANKAVLLDDRWASAREDLVRLATGSELPDTVNFTGAGQAVADQATWWAKKTTGPVASRLKQIAKDAVDTTDGAYAGKVAVVTGMTPASIAGGLVGGLLAGGATVIATASRITPERLHFAKTLYREHARPGAALWLVPANLASYRDVDALVDWIGKEVTTTVGKDTKIVKDAYVPDFYFPFAAPSVHGSVADAGPAAENQARLLLWSVERSMTALAQLGEATHVDHKLHVVLPGSPNRGTFGGDGAYGEAKAGFDALCNKWSREPWGKRVTLAHPHIGWVAGTGLMGGNDRLVEAATEAGIHIYSPAEISGELLDLISDASIEKASQAPLVADLTGGLGDINLAELAADTPDTVDDNDTSAKVQALPKPARISLPHADWGRVSTSLDDMVVIVGLGEVGPWGHGRTRFEAEYGMRYDGSPELTPAGVLELAWMTGLLTWRDTPVAGWYDADENLVDEEDIFSRFRDDVIARCGVRSFIDEAAIEDLSSPQEVEVFLDRDVTFTVDSEAEARSLVDADPAFTTIRSTPDGWLVTRKAGGRGRVPKKTTLARLVGGQFPTDFDPAKWGIPTSLIESIDRIAVWNLVATVDAYVSAGFTPAEILEAVHPSQVAMTQGTGFGGMTSMRKLFVDRFLDHEIPSDILQETLPNVVAAHTMQNYVGGYGSMIHPVGACATAAVSIEEGVDKIALHKADFVVAGAIDDISVESISGFASMNATADSNVMAGKGLQERFYSRANDRRRGGFVESQGGGTVLLARGSLAAKLGLPVYGVVGFAQSYADGAHTSIPAPGLGALAAGLGGTESVMAKNLAGLGITADDISVLSKHDTSTNANDPNESELHTRLAQALGRSTGNPLLVVSQKTLTGHAKGGAALFQVAGLVDMFRTGKIPGNKSLDCVDPELADNESLVWLTSPVDHEVKAGLLTSLGFGHVSALVALVHPSAFEAALTQADKALAQEWHDKALARLKKGRRHIQSGMLGHADLFTPIESRRFDTDAHETEAGMLLDTEARLGTDGFYR